MYNDTGNRDEMLQLPTNVGLRIYMKCCCFRRKNNRRVQSRPTPEVTRTFSNHDYMYIDYKTTKDGGSVGFHRQTDGSQSHYELCQNAKEDENCDGTNSFKPSIKTADPGAQSVVSGVDIPEPNQNEQDDCIYWELENPNEVTTDSSCTYDVANHIESYTVSPSQTLGQAWAGTSQNNAKSCSETSETGLVFEDNTLYIK